MTTDNQPASSQGELKTVEDCGPVGCGECEVCQYFDYLEHAGSVGLPSGSTIERNARLDQYIKETYPWLM